MAVKLQTSDVYFQVENAAKRFRPWLCPGPHWASLQCSPDPLVGWGGGHKNGNSRARASGTHIAVVRRVKGEISLDSNRKLSV